MVESRKFGSVQKRISLSVDLQRKLGDLMEYINKQSDRNIQIMIAQGGLKSSLSVTALVSFAINFLDEMLVNAPEQDYQKRLEELRAKGANVGNDQKTTTSLEYKDLKPLFNNNELQTYLLLSIYQMIMDPNWVIGELTSYHGEQEDNTQRELIGKISQLIQMDTARGQTIKSTRQNKKKHRNNQ